MRDRQYPFNVDHEGEIIIFTIHGATRRLRIDEAQDMCDWLLRLAQLFDDEITRANGIEPRSGAPIWRPPAKRRKKLPPKP